MLTNPVFKTLDIQLFRERLFSNGEKLTRQCRKLLWAMVVFQRVSACFSVSRCFSVVEWNSTKHCIRSFLVPNGWIALNLNQAKRNELLPIMPIGSVADAFTLLRDSLCLNSCIYIKGNLFPKTYVQRLWMSDLYACITLRRRPSWLRRSPLLVRLRFVPGGSSRKGETDNNQLYVTFCLKLVHTFCLAWFL